MLFKSLHVNCMYVWNVFNGIVKTRELNDGMLLVNSAEAVWDGMLILFLLK